jgi:hypothetical protein
VFELGCAMAKNQCIDASSWLRRGAESGIASSLLLIMGRVILWNLMDRIAKVELHLCACHGYKPNVEPPVYGKDDEL